MKKVLIAGGAGFLGSHLCDRMISEGNEVLCLDKLWTGKISNIEQHLKNPAFEFIEHDIVEPFDFEVDEIYNLACPASPRSYQSDPIETTKTSVIGILNCLEVAKRCGATILQASTSEVYGDPEMHPQPESYRGNVNPIGVRSCYDEGKRCAESLCFDYMRSYGVNVKLVRIFNTYGPRMAEDDGRVVSNLIVEALKGNEMPIYGKGEQTRSFCYVDDLIEGFVRFVSTEGFHGPLNLGNPGEFTILQLAELILRIAESRSKLLFKPLPEDDPKRRKPNIDLATKVLRWRPEVNLEEGLEKTIEYFRSQMNDN